MRRCGRTGRSRRSRGDSERRCQSQSRREGPSLVELKTYRYRAHAEGVPDVSHADPRPKEELEHWMSRDPVVLFREKLLKTGTLTDADVERIEKATDAEIEELDKLAMESPIPAAQDPSILDHLLYAD
ncbi:thiamine pyrophosphate-dependent enzyme [Thermodesulfobacteriota bacterium]